MTKFITHDVTTYRMNNPDCEYCKHNNDCIPIGRVPECLALHKLCWNSQKTAKKCMLYIAREYK